MIALFKEVVLVTFFLFFTGLVAQLYLTRDRRDYARLPLEEE